MIKTKKLKILLLTPVIIMTCTPAITGCSSCRKTNKGTQKNETKQDAESSPTNASSEKSIHTAVSPILPEGQVQPIRGDFKIERNEAKPIMPIGMEEKDNLYIGDRLLVNQDSEVEVIFTTGGKGIIKGPAVFEIGTHLPGEVVLVRGIAEIKSPQMRGRTRRIKVQTPAGTYFHGGTESLLAVSRSGATKIYVKDCPSPDNIQENKQGDSSTSSELEISTCSVTTGNEEKPLASGDVLTVNSKMEQKLEKKQDFSDSEMLSWWKAEENAFEKNRNELIQWFSNYLQEGFNKIEEKLALMEKFRLENKKNIEKLKAVRNEETEKTSTTKSEKKDKTDINISQKMDDLKLKLAQTSKQMAREREIMLSRWYQIYLRWLNLEEFMNDEILKKVNKTKSTIKSFISSYDEKILQIVRRRPRRTMPPNLPAPPFENLKKKDSVE